MTRDTPRSIPHREMYTDQSVGMPAVKGRTHRQAERGAPTVILAGRVDVSTRDAAREAADALGISLAAYLERLVINDAQEHHVRPAGPFIQEALPVSA